MDGIFNFMKDVITKLILLLSSVIVVQICIFKVLLLKDHRSYIYETMNKVRLYRPDVVRPLHDFSSWQEVQGTLQKVKVRRDWISFCLLHMSISIYSCFKSSSMYKGEWCQSFVLFIAISLHNDVTLLFKPTFSRILV